MKYIFCGNMYLDVERDVKEMKNPLPVSDHKFQVNMLKGLIGNGQDVVVINVPRAQRFPYYKKKLIKSSQFILDDKILGRNVGFINLYALNLITPYFSLRKALLRQIKEFNREQVTLISYNVSIVQNYAMLYAKKKRKDVVLCGVAGDVHGEYNLFSDQPCNTLKEKIVSYIGIKRDKLSSHYDAFGFLTKYMAGAFGVEEKPHVVIEGFYSEDHERPAAIQSKHKTIFYAGFLATSYGIKHLLNAFELIKDDDYRLIIAGGGDDVETVKRIAGKDPRITYLGFITPSEVERQQQMATVLINPRTSDQEFVKYSFPSKNMECLASGKPYIAHKLICNPPEYDDHIQYPEDESDAALAAKIVEICEMPKEQRDAIGRRAREFILREKNPKKQMEKIVRMMDAI